MNGATITSTLASKIRADYLNNQPIDVTIKNSKYSVRMKTDKVFYSDTMLYNLTATRIDTKKIVGYPDMPVHVIKCTKKCLIVKAGSRKFKFPVINSGPEHAPVVLTGDAQIDSLDPKLLIKGAREVIFAKAKKCDNIEEFNRCNQVVAHLTSALEMLGDD